MKHTALSSCIALVAVLASSFAPPQDTRDDLPELDPAITVRELRHHVAFLASDELRGRAAGTPDAVRAAKYLARALEQAGVAPAGDDGTYLQAIPLVRWKHAGPPKLDVRFDSGEEWTAEAGVDFTHATIGEPSSTDWLDVRMVASLADLPDEPVASEAVYLDGSRGEREGWLAARGWADTSEWGLTVSTGSSRTGQPAGTPRSRMRPGLHGEAARANRDRSDAVTLRGDLGERFERGEIVALRLVYDATREEILDYNVLGRIDGAGTATEPGMANEAIVFSAHYDHIGVRGEGGGHAAEPSDADAADTIFNGADDDASGTAAVLELAQAFAARPQPARTLVFLLAAGEEVGLIGTNYYIEHPAVPLEQTVCNLNVEMIGRPDDLAGGAGKLWLTGFERTTLGPAFQELGLALVPDPHLEQNFFQRSDNYAFAVRGIVGQTLSSYNLHTDYHNVTDEIEAIDFAHIEAATRDVFRAATLLADGTLRPEWLPGGKPPGR